MLVSYEKHFHFDAERALFAKCLAFTESLNSKAVEGSIRIFPNEYLHCHQSCLPTKLHIVQQWQKKFEKLLLVLCVGNQEDLTDSIINFFLWCIVARGDKVLLVKRRKTILLTSGPFKWPFEVGLTKELTSNRVSLNRSLIRLLNFFCHFCTIYHLVGLKD